jgi:hypothetical protein
MDSTSIVTETWSPANDSQVLKNTDTPSQMVGWMREMGFGAKDQSLELLMEHVKPLKKVKQEYLGGSEAILGILTQTTM